MKRAKQYTILISLALLLAVIVCLFATSPGRRALAFMRPLSDFIPASTDTRILYEPGAEEFAREIVAILPAAVARVEEGQYRPFAKPVEVYVCATKDSFARHTGVSKEVSGAVTDRLFLSAERLKERLDGKNTPLILAHELSHLHLLQQLGIYGFGARVPAWFREGLAVNVSGGGGAETVSTEEARASIIAGKSLTPNTTESFLFPKYGSAFGLEPHMFYRQSALFVDYLKSLDENKFREFLLKVEDGGAFGESFENEYEIRIDEAWRQFLSGLHGETS